MSRTPTAAELDEAVRLLEAGPPRCTRSDGQPQLRLISAYPHC